MTYKTPEARRRPVNEALAVLKGSDAILLTTHINADGDGAGSEIALAAWLHALGKSAWIINPTPLPESLAFLIPDRSWVLDAGSAQAKEVAARADLAGILDTGEVPRIGPVAGLIYDPAESSSSTTTRPAPIPSRASRSGTPPLVPRVNWSSISSWRRVGPGPPRSSEGCTLPFSPIPGHSASATRRRIRIGLQHFSWSTGPTPRCSSGYPTGVHP